MAQPALGTIKGRANCGRVGDRLRCAKDSQGSEIASIEPTSQLLGAALLPHESATIASMAGPAEGERGPRPGGVGPPE
jgi:hypothetical protein